MIFFGGIEPPSYKSITKEKIIRTAKVPKRIILPLSQHTGKPSQPIVGVGDYVEVGATVARSSGFVSANIHSSVSGTVKAIEEAPHPVLGKFSSIIIESDDACRGEPTCSPKMVDVGATRRGAPTFDVDKLSSETIIQAIADAGIVGMGGAGFPTHVKLSPPKDKKIDTLIINGAECEPYLTCDYRLMLENPEDILRGAQIIAKALGVNNVIIAIEDNKPEAIEAMRTVIARSLATFGGETTKQSLHAEIASLPSVARNDVCVVILPTKYPQGAEKQLIKTLTGREVPSGGLPFDIGVVVQNVATPKTLY